MLDLDVAKQIIRGASCDAFHIVEECCYEITGGSGFILERLIDNLYISCIYASGTAADYWGSAMLIKGTLSEEGYKHKVPYRAQDTFNDPRVNREKALLAKSASTLVVPLYEAEKAPYGILKITSVVPSSFTGQHVAAMDDLQQVLSDLFINCFDWN